MSSEHLTIFIPLKNLILLGPVPIDNTIVLVVVGAVDGPVAIAANVLHRLEYLFQNQDIALFLSFSFLDILAFQMSMQAALSCVEIVISHGRRKSPGQYFVK